MYILTVTGQCVLLFVKSQPTFLSKTAIVRRREQHGKHLIYLKNK